ncbi:hypothetical protein JGH11_03875 [Dysgonomonas sp. Marseille-P4677]|uniref:hypothetical protein n=1 Tax=Dysgonomonas sp. Marseille-P4677 TaxID=2364790 RepID=UPI001912428E|nr:hypothetical protein [Dysgonomonas sp. Marseille-P4677]MBK5720004.1 hypothetical protein [Dysgonomonas sp. Marseille-P4677]
MKDLIKLIGILLSSLLFACSSDNGDDGNNGGGGKDDIWDKSRTAKVLIISDLSAESLFPNSNYTPVVNAIKAKEQNAILLNNTNVSFSETEMINPAVKVAHQSLYMPYFVPYGRADNEYLGNTILFGQALDEMEQTILTTDCWMFQAEIAFTSSLKMRFLSASINSDDQITPAVSFLKNNLFVSTLVVGTVKRSVLSKLESSLSTTLTKDSYMLDIIDNTGKSSEYCIYVLGSSKWKLRDVTESVVSGDIKSFLIQIELLK